MLFFHPLPSTVRLFIIIFIELRLIATISAPLDKFTLLQVSYLLEGNPDRMNFRVKDTGMTPLHAAVKSGSVATLKVILESLMLNHTRGAGTIGGGHKYYTESNKFNQTFCIFTVLH